MVTFYLNLKGPIKSDDEDSLPRESDQPQPIKEEGSGMLISINYAYILHENLCEFAQ